MATQRSIDLILTMNVNNLELHQGEQIVVQKPCGCGCKTAVR